MITQQLNCYSNSVRVFISFLIFCLTSSTVFAEDAKISAIRIDGITRVDQATVLDKIESAVGQPIRQEVVSEDIRRIYRIGFFKSVEALLDGNTLVFAVKEKPSIRSVKVSGNDNISEKRLKDQLTVGNRRFLDLKKLQAAVEQTKAYYLSQGYYGTEIDYKVVDVSDSAVDITFHVTEGKKKVIREISFEGNNNLSSSELSDLLATSRYHWWSSWITGGGVVKEDQLAADVQAITRYYLTKGYADVQVGTPSVVELEDGLQVVYKINEGELYTFGSVHAEGTLFENSEAKTLEGISIVPGETFNAEYLQKDTFFVSDKFTDIGYAFANVEPLTSIDREKRTVSVNFRISKGEIVTINRINVVGNNKSGDNVVRRSLKIGEREQYSSSKVKRSQELLQRLGYFDEVSITTNPSVNKNEIDLDVAVREGSTGAFSIGAGFSSGDGAIFTARVSESNFFGSGKNINLDVNTGSRRENIILSLEDPRVNDTQWSAGVELLSTKRIFDDFDRDQTGGSATIGYPLSFLGEDENDVRLSLTYEYLMVDISDIEDTAADFIKAEEGETTASTIRPRLIRNTIDNPLDPSKGSRQVLSVDLTGLGGDQEFWLANFTNTFYYPLIESEWGDIVFSQRFRLGYGDSFNDNKLPLYVRYFPGGIDSVRGYEARKLGPTDDSGSRFGGSKQLVANFELIFPMLASAGLKGLVFYDTGEAFDDSTSLDFAELRQAVGFGLRWKTPIAPIRVEIGYPLDKQEGDKSVVTNFSFGAPL
jgi:outer membrane protein insertion porin family